MKFKRMIAGAAGMAIMLSTAAAAFASAGEDQDAAYTEDSLTVHKYSHTDTDTIACRYYNGFNEMPYIKLSDFYKLFSGKTMKITPLGDDVYSVEANGITARFNTALDTISSSDPVTFFTAGQTFDDLFAKPIETASTDETVTVIELSPYGIDMEGSENDIWLPVQTLCDIYQDDVRSAALVDQQLDFFDSTEFGYSILSVCNCDHIENLLAEERSEKMIDFTYNELCFVIDTFYSFPGRIPLDSVLKEKGFDAMLDTNEDTRRIKELLLSPDCSDFLVGMALLEIYMYDGGHTTMNPLTLLKDEIPPELADRITEETEAFIQKTKLPNINDRAEHVNEISEKIIEARRKNPPVETSNCYAYFKNGETAIFTFNDFLFEYAAWKNYYDGGKMPKDVLGSLYKKMVEAENDPEIKNFVIDVTTNPGGTDVEVMYILSLITNRCEVSYDVKEALTGKFRTRGFLIDKNLDRKFDGKDKDMNFTLNFGVMTSDYSFSCANLFASLAKDAGILVIGEKSNGGAGEVIEFTTACGVPFELSAKTMIYNAAKKDIDGGIEPDIVLDYDDLYDPDVLSAAFAEFYGKPKPEPADSTPDSSSPEPDPREQKGQNPPTGQFPMAAAIAAAAIAAAVLSAKRKEM